MASGAADWDDTKRLEAFKATVRLWSDKEIELMMSAIAQVIEERLENDKGSSNDKQ